MRATSRPGRQTVWQLVALGLVSGLQPEAARGARAPGAAPLRSAASLDARPAASLDARPVVASVASAARPAAPPTTPVGPRRRPAPRLETKRWPPEAADPAARWYASNSGPLGRLADYAFETAFRRALAAEAGGGAAEAGDDGAAYGFPGVAELARRLAAAPPRSADETTRRAQSVLRRLFPDWPPAPWAPERPGLLAWFEVLFARPFPAFSAKLNALVTFSAGGWLMGPLELEDLEGSTVGDGVGQMVVVRRCRFLEESACASVCVNACKMPTQNLFNSDMGVPMTIEPDYDNLSCKFKFGIAPTADEEAAARAVPCFGACPSAYTLRETHQDACPDMSLFESALTPEQLLLVAGPPGRRDESRDEVR